MKVILEMHCAHKIRCLCLCLCFVFLTLGTIFLQLFEFDVKFVYYIDRCELWGFIREINSGISHVRYQVFFPPELLYITVSVIVYVPCCATVNTHTIVN
jgi:hypothetical protein